MSFLGEPYKVLYNAILDIFCMIFFSILIVETHARFFFIAAYILYVKCNIAGFSLISTGFILSYAFIDA